jgi:hypothetical protein
MLINTNNIYIMLRPQTIFIFACILFVPVTGVFAATSSDDGNSTGKASWHTTPDHPPHDHQHNDHIKKLDEGMRRKREDEGKSH